MDTFFINAFGVLFFGGILFFLTALIMGMVLQVLEIIENFINYLKNTTKRGIDFFFGFPKKHIKNFVQKW